MATPQTETREQATQQPQRLRTAAGEYVEVPHLADMELILGPITPSHSTIGDESIATYDLTFTAVVPEALAPIIIAAARDHRLRIRLLQPDESVKA